MTLPTPQAFIFDWDNTLVDTWPVIHAALNATLGEMGYPLWTFEETKARVRKSMRDSFPEIFGQEAWEKAGSLYQAHYRSRHLENLQPLPRSKEVLERIATMGVPCVVVSNKKGPNLRTEVTHLGWDHLFDTIVGADDAQRDKPHRDPVELAFAQSHIKPNSHVWFIGDSDIDLHCAFNTGCTAILYGPEAHGHPDYTATHFGGHPYHAHVRDHSEMLSLLER